MTNRRTIFLTIIATALLALCLPALAAAQGTYDPYGRPDYRRNRDDNYGRSGRYNRDDVRDSIRRLDNLSGDFERDFDRALDHSRVDGTRREDRVNSEAKDFRRAVKDLKSRFGDGRDLNRSVNEAQRVLQLGSNVSRVVRRLGDDRTYSEWSQINNELRFIANAYGISFNGYDDGGYYGNDPYGRNRNQDRRRNDDVYRRRSSVGDILRRIPF
jgi:hypothetical protein